MHRLRWLFELRERFSGPAAKIKSALGGIESMLGKIKSADPSRPIERLGDKLLRLNAGLEVLGKVSRTMKGMAGLAIDVGKGTFDIVKSALDPAIFKERALTSLKVMFKGNMEEARKFYEDSVSFASMSPFGTEQSVNAAIGLKSSAFSSKKEPGGTSDVDWVMKIAGNLASTNTNPEVAFDAIIAQFKQIKSQGALRYEELKILAESWNLPMDAVYEELARSRNKSIEAVKKEVSVGKIKWVEGFKAMGSVIEGRFGGMMDEQSKTAGGILSTIQSRPFELLSGLADTGGFDITKNFLSNISSALDPKGAGAEIQMKLIGMFNDLTGMTLADLAGPGGDKKIAGLIIDVLGKIQRAIPTIGAVFNQLGELIPKLLDAVDMMLSWGESLGLIATKDTAKMNTSQLVEEGKKYGISNPLLERADNAGVFEGMTSPSLWGAGAERDKMREQIDMAKATQMLEQNPALQQEIFGYFSQMGQWAAQGLFFGATSSGLPQQAGATMGNKMAGGTAGALQIESPSKVFEAMGIYTAEGFANGLGRARSLVADSTYGNIVQPALSPMSELEVEEPSLSPMGEAPSRPSLGSSMATAGSKPTITINISVEGGGNADEIAEKVKAVSVEAVLEALERYDMEASG